MDERLRQAVTSVGLNPDVVDKLDEVLAGPNDRAFIMCAYQDCTFSVKGRCTIFTLLDVPKMKTSGPCDRYQARPKEA